MNDNKIHTQYSTGLSRRNIEQSLLAAGKDLNDLAPADLGLLEDFHTLGRIATSQLVDLVDIAPEDEVLDAGSGIGGTARFVAERCQCHVSADRSDRGVLRDRPLAQSTRWTGRPDFGAARRRHATALRRRHLSESSSANMFR